MNMRLFLAGAFLLASTTTFAQTATRTAQKSQFSLGPVVEFGHSWVSNLPGTQPFNFAPAVGLGMMYSANEHWGLGSKLLFSSEGYRQTFDAGAYHSEYTVRPMYLRIPLEATYFFGNYGDNVRPKIFAGPSVGFKLGEHQTTSGDPLPPTEYVNYNSDKFSSVDIGLTTGIGANVRVGKLTWLNVDAGYYHGFTDIHTNSDYNANRNIRMNVGLLWGL
jgi:hypothetical protein